MKIGKSNIAAGEDFIGGYKKKRGYKIEDFISLLFLFAPIEDCL